MKLFDQLQEAGNTLIVITHEEYIANHARRTLRLSDGKVVSDTASGGSQ
jgi:putative ABC transport system ATP-binding protein